MIVKKKESLGWVKVIAIAIIAASLLRSFVFATSIVQGESMDPTIQDGERLLFNKVVYLVGEPNRGDIVIIKRPIKNYVKRVIALPHETITVKDKVLYINGERYTQTFLDSQDLSQTGDFGPVEVPGNSYFVMGDNRLISKDSRNGLGFVTKEEIIGRSEFVIYPFSEWTFTR
ncbi:signal peptidase I [Aquibacillus albus]|uniref:Signal peptidase I n=1 Tax=Aquibacillus albus TaxID=1168171 RepID=A0ABS2N240_9BACI|nr:signal peptidase I [Aquibacillus albus]MBM7572201.1 signal peptidase I [Aquibacillus albus]